MSHFSVMVIGDNVDQQLQPFHEYECTGIQDRYVIWVDHTDEVKAEWEKEERRSEYADIDTMARDWFGYDSDGNGGWGRRTNPNAKWDWWVIGGRWTGYLKLKPGAAGVYGQRSWTNKDEADDMDRCDQARKGDIDVQGMRDEAEARARKNWEQARGTPPCPAWLSWGECMARHPSNSDAARDLYHSQEPVKRISKKMGPFGLPDVFLTPREEYVENARNSALATFAYVKDAQWFERGTMGWFACVVDEKDHQAWAREFNKAFDELPDDTLITIVDGHI